jgi:deoxyribose-phosphate aldolase
MEFTYQVLAGMIDHSLLKPTITDEELEEGCRVGVQYKAATVCIMPYYLKRCAEILHGSGVKPSTTIGFPHGLHTTSIKVAEARQALDDGGLELDMVVNISKVLSNDWQYVEQEIKAVVELAHARDGLVKVIFENCYLEDAQKIKLCEICTNVGADWVKTSTGFGTGGAEDADLKLMKDHVGPDVQVKAAGGVRSLDRLLEVRAIGCTRAGATQTVKILEEAKARATG